MTVENGGRENISGSRDHPLDTVQVDRRPDESIILAYKWRPGPLTLTGPTLPTCKNSCSSMQGEQQVPLYRYGY
jgi:hypothetical protein